jgi:hypothetical protein
VTASQERATAQRVDNEECTSYGLKYGSPEYASMPHVKGPATTGEPSRIHRSGPVVISNNPWCRLPITGHLIFVSVDHVAQPNAQLVVSNGGTWPCGEGSTLPGDVIFMSAEDGIRDTIAVDVRFGPHNGLKSDVRPCPLCADIVL